MAQQNPGSPSRAFFMELVLVLTIFVFCAAVCLQVFAEAKTSSETSRALSVLTVEAQSMAESFKASNANPQAIAKASAAGVAADDANKVVAYYDEEFLHAIPGETPYSIVCAIEQPKAGSSIAKANITVIEHGKAIASIDVSQYIPASTSKSKGGVGR
jgi:type II secretory pathway pseudopilin PulG